jgi:hypothetical protein
MAVAAEVQRQGRKSTEQRRLRRRTWRKPESDVVLHRRYLPHEMNLKQHPGEYDEQD